jgi:hypothetical protein
MDESQEDLTDEEIWSRLNLDSALASSLQGLVDWVGIYYIVTRDGKANWNLLFHYILQATDERGRINPLLTLEEVSVEPRYLAYIAILMGADVLVTEEFRSRANSYLLCWACRLGNQTAVAKLLLNSKINPSFWRGTPLIEACSHNTSGHVSIVRLLLNDSRVDINLQGPIRSAIKSKSLEAVRLLSEDYRTDKTGLLKACYDAARRHRIEIVDLLLNHYYVNTHLDGSIILKAVGNPKTQLEAIEIYQVVLILLTDKAIVPPINLDVYGKRIIGKVKLLDTNSRAGLWLKSKLINLLGPWIARATYS